MELTKQNLKKIIGVAAFAILFHWALQNLGVIGAAAGVILALAAPFLVGCCIAFVLNVPMRFLEKLLFAKKLRGASKKKKTFYRILSILLTLALVVGVVCIVVFSVIPELGRSINTLRDLFPGFLREVEALFGRLEEEVPGLQGWINSLEFDFKEIQDAALGFLQNRAGHALGSMFDFASSVFSGIVTFFLGCIFSIYVLMQKETLGRQARMVLFAFLPKEKAEFAVSIGKLTNKTFSSFLSGQCLEAFILGFLFFLGLSVFGFPYALMISVLVGFTALIPIFGAFIGCFIGAFMVLMVSPMRAFWFIVLFLVIQQIEGNLIYPKVVGNSVGLPSIWVLVAVTVGASTMGILGMLLFIPLASVCYALLRQTVYRRLRKRGIPPERPA